MMEYGVHRMVTSLVRSGMKGDSVSVAVLDLATHAWASKKTHGEFSLAVKYAMREGNGHLYVIESLNGPFWTTLEEYEPTTDKWTALSLPAMLRSNFGPRVVGFKGGLYIFGGRAPQQDPNYSNKVFGFDAVQAAWLPAPDFLEGRHEMGLVPIGSSIYLVGGQFRNNIPTPSVEEYRPE